MFLKRSTVSADLPSVEQDTLDNLGFSLDLMYLAAGLDSDDAPASDRTMPPQVEELEQLLRAVITSAGAE